MLAPVGVVSKLTAPDNPNQRFAKMVGAVGVEPTNPEGVSFTDCALWPLAYTPKNGTS